MRPNVNSSSAVSRSSRSAEPPAITTLGSRSSGGAVGWGHDRIDADQIAGVATDRNTAPMAAPVATLAAAHDTLSIVLTLLR
jgi:hypothetical protein